MKATQDTTRWLGFALACGMITFAASVQAGKPVKPPKPPPEPPPPAGPAYWIIPVEDIPLLEGIGDSGTLVGAGAPNAAYMAPCSLTPRIFEGEVQYHSEDLQWLSAVDGTLGVGTAFAVNQAGLAVGYTGFPNRAMLWLPDGTPIDLGLAPVNAHTRATAINDSGLVAVGYPDHSSAGVVVPLDTNGDGAPDLWFVDEPPEDGTNDLYFPIETGNSLTPVAVNRDGQVALKEGYLLTPDFSDADGDGNPWFADVDGDNVNDLLVALVGPHADVEVADLNNGGQVVGNSRRSVMLWDSVDGAQVVTDLGSVSPASVMQASGMNDSGRIVGTSTKANSLGGPSWLIENGILYELLPLVVNPEGWETLGLLHGINSLGWICGTGLRVEGGFKSFVAIPVQP